MSDLIQSLWIGPTLSVMERLAITSFQRHGHDFHLYVYDEVAGVPAGTVLRDAREILPSTAIFQYRDHASYGGFANSFRYKLLAERGGWWVDADVVCLRPFTGFPAHVFASEVTHDGEVAANCVIKAPAGSEIMVRAWEACQQKDPQTLAWGETGPRLLGSLIRQMDREDDRVAPSVFCPLPFDQWATVLAADPPWTPPAASHGLHLWNEMWRRAGRDKEAAVPPGCCYARLCAAVLGTE